MLSPPKETVVFTRSNLCRSQLELKEVTWIGSNPAFCRNILFRNNRKNPVRRWATSVPLSHKVAEGLFYSIQETETVSSQRLSVLGHLNVLSSTLWQPYTPSNLCFYFQRNRGHKSTKVTCFEKIPAYHSTIVCQLGNRDSRTTLSTILW